MQELRLLGESRQTVLLVPHDHSIGRPVPVLFYDLVVLFESLSIFLKKYLAGRACLLFTNTKDSFLPPKLQH